MNILTEERGSVSLLGLGALGVLTALGAIAFAVAQQHFDAVRLFSEGVSLRQEAQNGIIAASDRIGSDSGLRDSIPVGEVSQAVLEYPGLDGAGGTVYARRQGDEILLLSVSSRDAGRGQVMASLKERDGRWRIAYWEH